MTNILKHWKTSSAGIIAIITGIYMIVQDHTKVIEASTAIMGGIGLLFAADSSTTV